MCNLGQGRALTQLPQGAFDAIALAGHAGGALVAWSSAEGSFALHVDDAGAPRGAPARWGERCAGGLALATASPGSFWLACLRPTQSATLVRLEVDLHVGAPVELGPAGRDSEGIAAVASGSEVTVAYHDGTPGAYGVFLVQGDGQRFEPRQRLSDPAHAATAPGLALGEGRWIASWVETRFDAEGETATRIALKREGGTTRTLGETPTARPDPRVHWGEQGPWLGFRSRRKRDRRSQLYVTRLDESLQPRGQPVRVGRANTPAAPVLLECGEQRFVLMSRLYAGERYVALYPLDDALQSLGGGYQYYENGRDYERIAATCGAHGPLLLAAERPKGPRGGARLTAAALRCPDVVKPHGCSFPCTSR